MSKQSIVINKTNLLAVNTDRSKVFLGCNKSISGTLVYANSDEYEDVTLVAGSVLGRKSSDQKLHLLAKGASDGTQYPVGVLAEDVIVPAGDSIEQAVDIIVSGKVDEDQLAFVSGTVLSDVISSRSIRDRLASDTLGLLLVKSTELTGFDNS